MVVVNLQSKILKSFYKNYVFLKENSYNKHRSYNRYLLKRKEMLKVIEIYVNLKEFMR